MQNPTVRMLLDFKESIEERKKELDTDYQNQKAKVIEDLAAFQIDDPVCYEQSSTVYYVKSRDIDILSDEGVRYMLAYAKKDGSPSKIVAIYFALQNQLKHA